jgi:hypothetical protein
MVYHDNIKCVPMTLDAKGMIRAGILSLMIVLMCCGMALAGNVDEGNREYAAESSSGIVNAETPAIADETGTTAEEKPHRVGDILVGNKTVQPDDKDAPPLPLAEEEESIERALDHLPRDTNIDTIRGYTTAHSLPARKTVPSPGLITVHDADRTEEERLFFGFLSYTIRW